MKRIVCSFLFLLVFWGLYGQNQVDSAFDFIRNGNSIAFINVATQNLDVINHRDEQGVTPMILSAYYGQNDILDFLIAKNAIDTFLCDYGTVYHALAYKNNAEYIERLSSHTSAKNICRLDFNKSSPLHVACASGNEAAAIMLLKIGCSSIEKDATGNSALDYCRQLKLKKPLTWIKSQNK